jgi:hypothetical protein
MPDVGVYGMPGVRTYTGTSPKIICRQGSELFLAGGKGINGALSRDPGNTGDLAVLRPGLLMGKITASGKYAPSVIGVTQAAKAAAATDVAILPAQAVELARRIGPTGTVRFVGPPTAAGTVATFTETLSAIDTTTGVLTHGGLDAALIAGSFVVPNDGSQIPVTAIYDGTGKKVTDADGLDLDVPFERLLIGGVLTPSQLIPWPSDTSLQAWVRTNLSTASAGKFTFDDQY